MAKLLPQTVRGGDQGLLRLQGTGCGLGVDRILFGIDYLKKRTPEDVVETAITRALAGRAPGADPLVLRGHTGSVPAVAWGALDDKAVLASGGRDGTVRLWDPAAGAQLQVLEAQSPVHAVVWCGVDDRVVLASAGDDRTVRLWTRPPVRS